MDKLLYVFAFVLFVLAALNVPKDKGFNLIAAGLACLTATLIF